MNFKTKKREELNSIIPENPNQPYDIRSVISEVADQDTFFEVHKNYADNIVVGFCRLAGRSIGIVANQPAVLAGVLDVESSKKGARFVRFCDAFNIPLLVFEDVSWFFTWKPIRNGTLLSLMVLNYFMRLAKLQFQELQ